MREITQNAFDNLIKQYLNKNNFEQYTIDGSLIDNYILTADDCKTSIIREKYLNEWSSCYTLIMYNKTPKKYQKIIEHLQNDEQEQAGKLFFAR